MPCMPQWAFCAGGTIRAMTRKKVTTPAALLLICILVLLSVRRTVTKIRLKGLPSLQGHEAGPQIFDRARKHDRRTGVEGAAVHEQQEPVVCVNVQERVITHSVGNETEHAPEQDQRDMLHDFDSGGFCGVYPALVSDLVVLPVSFDPENQKQDRELKRNGDKGADDRDKRLRADPVNRLHGMVIASLGKHSEKGSETRKHLPDVCTKGDQDPAATKQEHGNGGNEDGIVGQAMAL